jgi:ureidoglycolate amidohydrolase
LRDDFDVASLPTVTGMLQVQQAIRDAADSLNLSTKYMVSRAYHDSLFMARIAPTGMIFIPCRGGYSHRPDEFASEEDIKNGVGVLALTMAKLSGGQWTTPEAADQQQLREEL